MARSNKYPKVAVAILAFNGLAYTKQFMPAVLKSTYPNLDVYVIDNASNDATISFLKDNYPSVKIIELQSNEGFAGGYNTGLSKIEADYFVLLNQDVTVCENWIEPIIELMEVEEKIAVAQPKILAQKQPDYFEYAGAAGGFIDVLGYPFCRGRIFDTIEKDEGQYNDAIACFWASGAAFFIRADIFKKVGGFDTSFFAHMEEIDLCWRIKRCGYTIYVEPKSVVYHVGGSVLDYQSPNKAYLNFRNGLALLHKNLNTTEMVWKLPLRIILDVVAALRALLSGQPKIFAAIIKAIFHYFKGWPFWWKQRGIAKQIITVHHFNKSNKVGMFNKSIIWQYFIKKKKQYSDLIK